jgi:ATP-dependent DNA ligase I
VLLEEIARVSYAVAAASGRLAKVELLAGCLRDLTPDELPVAVAYLSGGLPHDPIGVGWRSVAEMPPPAAAASLELLDVDAAARRVGATTGGGSRDTRRRELSDLFARATEPEQRFLRRLLVGELRQGALEGVMVDAVGRAFDVPAKDVRRALMLAGDLGSVAQIAAERGRQGLAEVRLQPLRPIQPMLAQTAGDVGEALGKLGRATIEWKLDGARLQLHRTGDEVRAFTRNLADVTARVPEIVEAARAIEADAIVLDGEAIAMRPDGGPHPFQVTMARFGSRVGVDELRAETPLTCFLFDCLHLDGEDLLDRAASDRLQALDRAVPASLRVPRIETDDPAEAEAFLDDVLARGHEGVMVKSLDAPYEAGRRGGGWLKVKRATTFDLVVLAAEWGHGRRQGKLSNIHLGARDPAGGFVMLGKTFKGMTDEMLAWQTERLLELETRQEGHVVHVRPELVVEVAFDGVQRSSRYPGGVALRFARVKGYRPDKRPGEADTIESVIALAPPS